MGFWSLLTGVDATAGAYNAVLMEHALQVMPPEYVDLLAEYLPETVRSGLPGVSAAFALSRFQEANRIVQLNLLAFSMAELQQAPALGGELWMGMKNPFAALPDTPAIRAKVRIVEGQMLQKHGVDISVPHYRLNFYDLRRLCIDQRTTLSLPAPAATPPHPTIAELFDALEQRYNAGLLSDDEMTAATLALGHLIPVCRAGVRTVFKAANLFDEDSYFGRFLTALRLQWEGHWADLDVALHDQLRTAAFVHAVEMECVAAVDALEDLSLSAALEGALARMVESKMV